MPEPLTAREGMRSGRLGIVVRHRDRAMAWMVAANLARELGHELKDEPPVGMKTPLPAPRLPAPPSTATVSLSCAGIDVPFDVRPESLLTSHLSQRLTWRTPNRRFCGKEMIE